MWYIWMSRLNEVDEPRCMEAPNASGQKEFVIISKYYIWIIIIIISKNSEQGLALYSIIDFGHCPVEFESAYFKEGRFCKLFYIGESI